MIKTKNKVVQLPLVITGYTLFSLLLISVFLSTTLPWTSILVHPNSIKVNVVIAMVSLTVGALLPVLVGYFIGDRSVKSKSKLSHHFNGVLFGLLAYWFMILTSAFVAIPSQLFFDNNVRLILANLIPSIGVAIIATIIAIMHARSRQAKLDVVEYKPFVLVFIVSIIAMPLLSVINNITTNSVNIFTFFTPSIVVIVGLVAYATLRKLKLSSIQKLAWSAVSLSVLFVTVFVMNLFESAVMGYLWQPSAEVQSVGVWLAFAVAVVGWAVYWKYQLRALRRANK
jgi:hypothetical protein